MGAIIITIVVQIRKGHGAWRIYSMVPRSVRESQESNRLIPESTLSSSVL